MIQSLVLQDITQLNFLPLMVIIFLFIFIKINDPYEHKITVLFTKTLIFLLLLIICDNLDYACYNSESLPKWLHVVSAALGYNLRIWCLLSLVYIVLRDERKTKKLVFLLSFPAIICAMISVTPFFSHLMFWYDENNVMNRGPLSFVPHIVSLIYSIILISYAVTLKKRRSRRDEGLIIISAISFMLLATLFEMLFQLRGILMGMISIAITFYYLYIHIAHFRQDALTGTLNRTSFYADIKRYGGSDITALISIDVNDLKKTNDSLGHDAGDHMLIEVSRVIQKNLSPGCELYRIGGDEFFVICLKLSEDEIDRVLHIINTVMLQTKYTWACGVGIWEEGMEFIDVYKNADKMMYDKKFEMKQKQSR